MICLLYSFAYNLHITIYFIGFSLIVRSPAYQTTPFLLCIGKLRLCIICRNLCFCLFGFDTHTDMHIYPGETLMYTIFFWFSFSPSFSTAQLTHLRIFCLALYQVDIIIIISLSNCRRTQAIKKNTNIKVNKGTGKTMLSYSFIYTSTRYVCWTLKAFLPFGSPRWCQS